MNRRTTRRLDFSGLLFGMFVNCFNACVSLYDPLAVVFIKATEESALGEPCVGTDYLQFAERTN